MHYLQSALFGILPFVLVIGAVITIHELGHFLAAKLLGTKIDRFAIGFGRPLLQRVDRSGVQWRVGWMPIGGYVRFAGDENVASIPDVEDLKRMRGELIAEGRGHEIGRYFHFKPIWQRTIVILAGPVANFILAISIFALLAMTMGENVLPFRVMAVRPHSAAAVAGFQVGDHIVGVDGRRTDDFADIQRTIRMRGGAPTSFTVERGGRLIQLTATPKWELQKDPVAREQRVGVLGVTPAQRAEDYIRVRHGPLGAVAFGVRQTWDVVTSTVYYIGRIVTGQVNADQLRGPLGIADVAKNVTRLSVEGAPDVPTMLGNTALNLVNLIALISVSIGFMNLLPVPVLDGGHLLFYAYEAVARRPLAAKVQAAGYRVGLALVLGLMLFATWNDLQRLRVFHLFGGLFS
ncbi:MAG: RIP metalloprotease RseP [Caulobacterales bacterium]|nr:RIP metalloprotease RseP [Caulobacterales bacterium]